MTIKSRYKMAALLVTALVLLLVFTIVPVVPEASAQDGYGYGVPRGGGGPRDEDPDCGKNPYKWNPFLGQYERPFSKWCEPITGDPNESLLHDTYWGG
jgi:hypothetical protein